MVAEWINNWWPGTSLDFRYVALVVDKAELGNAPGLRYKGSFHKFLSRTLFERLNRGVPNLVIVMDEMGTDEFKRGFQEYIDRNQPMDLIYSYDFLLRDSKKDRLIQLADIIAGTLARVFDPGSRCARARDFMKLLAPHQSEIIRFPSSLGSNFLPESSPHSRDVDHLVGFVNLKAANLFLEKYEGNESDDRKMQVYVLSSLITQALFGSGFCVFRRF